VVAADEVDAIGVALLVAAAIEASGGTYFVGGSVASSLHGDPRSTNDIDFVLSLSVGSVAAFRRALGPAFELDEEMLEMALAQSATANGFYLPVLTKIDLFGLGRSPYDVMEFSRRRAVVVRASGETLIIKSPEDSVLRKILWYRQGGGVSDRQWRDVVSILRVSEADLDEAYLSEWARRLQCEDLLARAKSDADPTSIPPKP
jgi:hypothetical protein